jgi:hypothetical protein
LEVAQPASLGPSGKNNMEMKMSVDYRVQSSASQYFFAHGPLLTSKNNHGPFILVGKNVCPDHRYPTLKNYTSELILDSCKYIPLALHDLTLIKNIVARFAVLRNK